MWQRRYSYDRQQTDDGENQRVCKYAMLGDCVCVCVWVTAKINAVLVNSSQELDMDVDIDIDIDIDIDFDIDIDIDIDIDFLSPDGRIADVLQEHRLGILRSDATHLESCESELHHFCVVLCRSFRREANII